MLSDEQIEELERITEQPFPVLEDAAIVIDALPALIAELRELRADRERLLSALALIMPDPLDWPGYENAQGEEIGTQILAAIDAAGAGEKGE